MLPSADSIVYTAIFGNYDVLRPPVSVPGVKFLCFTDADISCGGWDVIKVPAKFRSPRLSAKYYKVMAHEVITCRRSLWIDGRLQFAGLGGGWDSMQHNIAFCRHHARNCVYDEANLCISHAIGDPPKIREAIAKYRVEGYPANNGLYRGGTIWRKHVPEVAEFNAAWWLETKLVFRLSFGELAYNLIYFPSNR
jgi:hypothetical protein